jgi:hypothetical protein
LVNESDVAKLAAFCEANLDIGTAVLGEEYGYPSVPLCIIDAVFSIGVTYTSTENTVRRFCEVFDIPQKSEKSPPDTADQLSVSEFIRLYDEHGIDGITEKAYQNRQRTSSRGGILKAEAVLRFSEALSRYGVEYLQDVDKIVGNLEFESEIKNIPGQNSGISLRYFYMLVGEKNYIKPDRMIMRFVEQVTGKTFSIEEVTQLIIGACDILVKDYPILTPRLLDHMIWNYQRAQ